MALSRFERELAQVIADRAQIVGWDEAINWAAREYNVRPLQMGLMMHVAADYNDQADPSGRIPELQDFQLEEQGMVAPDVLDER
jgi:hypothetical protein